MRQILGATATLIGTVIGAGLLAIPYVISQAGFWTGVMDILIIGAILTIIHLYLGEITLRTKGFHQLTGYAEKYLGKKGKHIMLLTMMFGVYGALVAYLIGEGLALSAIFGMSPVFWTIIFFIITAVLIYYGLRAVTESETTIVPAMIVIVIIMAVFSIVKLDLAHFDGFNLGKVLVPYGIIFFGFLGTAAIPEMREELVNNEKKLKKAILLGMLIPMAVYLVFTFIVLGVTGASTTQVSTIGLGIFIGEHMVILGNLFAVFAMATCFLTLSLAIKEMYIYDYRLNKNLAWAMTSVIPIMIYFIVRDFAGFGDVIGITGGLAGGLTGILVILMAWKSKRLGNRKPEYSITKNKVLIINN